MPRRAVITGNRLSHVAAKATEAAAPEAAEASTSLPPPQFAVLVAVVRRVPLTLRTPEDVRGGPVAEGAHDGRQLQLAAAPLARRHLRYFHAALTAEI
jgi:hypothetical protein